MELLKAGNSTSLLMKSNDRFIVQASICAKSTLKNVILLSPCFFVLSNAESDIYHCFNCAFFTCSRKYIFFYSCSRSLAPNCEEIELLTSHTDLALATYNASVYAISFTRSYFGTKVEGTTSANIYVIHY